MQRVKTGFLALRGWAARRRKALLALVLVLAVAAGLLWRVQAARRAAGSGTTLTYTRTVTLTKGSLDDVVSATGTVESAAVSTVTTDLKYTVDQVLVAVGDAVEAGDVICTLDTSDLESQIAKLQENLADQTAQLQKQYDQAVSSRDTALADLNTAISSRDQAQSTYDSAKAALDTITGQLTAYQQACDTAQAAYQALLLQSQPGDLTAASTATPAPDNAASGADGDTAANGTADMSALADSGDTSLSAQIAAAKTALDQAQSELTTMQTGLGYTAAQQSCTAAEQALEQAKTAAEQAQKTYDSAQQAVDTAAEALDGAGESDELESLYEQVENCTLRAKTAGKVTALDATVGSQPGTVVATIQDTGSLQISIEIPEYDIESVSVGLPVRITTDVTDETFTGTVSQISPTATGGGTSSSQFAAQVLVDGSPEALRIGTNASVDIILSSTEDVFTVPLDAIGQDAAGQDVIYLQTGTDEAGDPVFEAVPVTVGATNDYYAEVSGDDLTEGAVVRAAADPEAALAEMTLPQADSAAASGALPQDGAGMTGAGGAAGGMPAGGDTGGGNMPAGGRGDMGGGQGGAGAAPGAEG